MRKVVALELVSVDGVFESPEEWAFPYSDEEVGEANAAGMASSDALLFGRVTIERSTSMGEVVLDMAMSLDGFIAGPNDEDAGLYDWFFPPSERRNVADVGVVEKSIGTTGAILMGRRTHDRGERVAGFAGTPQVSALRPLPQRS